LNAIFATYLKLTLLDMKHFYTSLGAVLILFMSFSAQAQWSDHDISSDLQLLRSIEFSTTTNGFIGGVTDVGSQANQKGHVLKTTNSGASWSNVHSVSSLGFIEDVFFLDQNNGFAGGSRDFYPYLAWTTDGGSTWDTASVTLWTGGLVETNIRCMYFHTTTLGFVGTSSNGIFKTTDGGVSWTNPKPGIGVNQLSFADANVGFAVTEGNGAVYKTTDGGTTWTSVFSTSQAIRGLDVVNSSTVYISTNANGSNQVQKTTDGGNNWTAITVTGATLVNDIDFISANTGYAAGSGPGFFLDEGKVYLTTNGGATWTEDHGAADPGITGYYTIHIAPSAAGVYAGGPSGFYSSTTNVANSIEEIEQVGLAVYPNPAKDALYITLPSNLKSVNSIKMIDLSGKVIAAPITLNGGACIVDLSNVAKGYYTVSIEHDGGNLHEKILKQ
jgi:photosystem II stability/assembly factor-like uncharacterized protein